MSKQTQQRTRLSLYMELSEIVGAMKNMAEVELHRTLRIEKNQKQALATAMEEWRYFFRLHRIQWSGHRRNTQYYLHSDQSEASAAVSTNSWPVPLQKKLNRTMNSSSWVDDWQQN